MVQLFRKTVSKNHAMIKNIDTMKEMILSIKWRNELCEFQYKAHFAYATKSYD